MRVPAENLIGDENQGFIGIMLNFNGERLGMAAGANAYARVCLEEAVTWAQRAPDLRQAARRPSGHPPQDRRDGAADERDAGLSRNLRLARAARARRRSADLALLKVQATQTMEFCAREAMQILGGAGYMRGNRVERIYREVRVNAIGGGSRGDHARSRGAPAWAMNFKRPVRS